MTFRQCLATVLYCLLGISTSLLPSAATAQASVTGQWTRLNDLPFGPIHEAAVARRKGHDVGTRPCLDARHFRPRHPGPEHAGGSRL